MTTSIANPDRILKVIRHDRLSIDIDDGETELLLTYNHNLGYPPVFDVFYHEASDGFWDKLPFPILDGGAIGNKKIDIAFNVEFDSETITIRGTTTVLPLVEGEYIYEIFIYDAKY